MPTTPLPNPLEPRQCASCGRTFQPNQKYHRYCDDCWEETDDAAPRPGEPADAWMDRIQGK